MKVKEFQELTLKALEDIAETLPKPDFDFIPMPCNNIKCPFYESGCGRNPKSINQFFNQAIETYINEHYGI